jgi:hypothetical protein
MLVLVMTRERDRNRHALMSMKRGIAAGMLIGALVGGTAGATILTASEGHSHETAAKSAQIAPARYPSTT